MPSLRPNYVVVQIARKDLQTTDKGHTTASPASDLIFFDSQPPPSPESKIYSSKYANKLGNKVTLRTGRMHEPTPRFALSIHRFRYDTTRRDCIARKQLNQGTPIINETKMLRRQFFYVTATGGRKKASKQETAGFQ